MNANGIRIAGLAIAVVMSTTGVGQQTFAANLIPVFLAPAVLSQTSAEQSQQRLTRKDVDRLLNQARRAIDSGNLEQAEALVRRCERADIRYPLLHFGLKAPQVRRELTEAKRAAGNQGARKANDPAPLRSSESAGRVGQPGELRDPFAVEPSDQPTESRSLPPVAAQQPRPLPQQTSQSGVVPASYPQALSQGAAASVPGLGPATSNPFKNSQLDRPESLPASIGLPGSARIGDSQETNSAGSGETVSGDNAPGSTGGGATVPIPDLSAPLPPSLDRPDSATKAANSASNAPAQSLSKRDAPLPAMGDRYSVTEGSNSARGTSDKQRALELMQQARQSMLHGDLDQAEAKVREASALNIPESRFLPGEDRPSALAWDIQQVRQMPAPPAGAAQPADSEAAPSAPPSPQEAAAVHVAEDDTTENVPASSSVPSEENLRFAQLPGNATEVSPTSPNRLPNPAQPPSRAASLLEEGENALRNNDRATALQLFNQAKQSANDLDPISRQRLEGHLQMLSPETDNGQSARQAPTNQRGGTSNTTDQGTQVLARQLQAELTKRQSEAQELLESDPRDALELLQETRQQVADADLPESMKGQLLRRVEISIGKTEEYIKQHSAEIELDEDNADVLAEIDRRRAVKVKVQEDVAELVDQFNRLRDEQRYEEMEIVAQRLLDLAPDEPVVQQVWQNAKFIRRSIMNQELARMREESNWRALDDVERSAIQEVGDGRELVFGDAKEWETLTKNRRRMSERNGRMSERELEIRRRLDTPVMLRYEDRPLGEVIDGLSKLTDVNIHLDARGLNQEGISTDTPVTINLSKEISLKSALNLILEELHLSYVIKDEVLQITSEQLRNGELRTETYPVADLVIPIPNFVPSNNMGLQGLLNDAHSAMGYGGSGLGAPGPVTLVNNTNTGPGANGAGNDVLAQQFSTPRSGVPNPSVPIGGGPGGLGGGANADFDSLIDLIISTVATDTWAENGGGEAEVRSFPTNLSLVVSQTQAVHEEIADLLEQLRRQQDLQVTIEVRFIRLNDDFFERIGVDFDMNIEDNTGISTEGGSPGALTPGASFEPRRKSAIVGVTEPISVNTFPSFTQDLDIQFRQDSFSLTAPTIGGFAGDVGSFGFSILSDIEATFLINAVQGDSRTNVLNAPKVTLFNGQQAFVADATQMPFVISVIPVVGEFASAQQPVIVVLSEGTLMSIQAVVSDDRRFVRLTVVPFFSDIGDVDTFTFEGMSSSTSSSSTSTDTDDDGEDDTSSDSEDTSNTVGTTVQLPTFSFVSVVTTVSVPDGGTVLLGGIKRLSEGRNERGIPLLSKVPYVNRLFRNVGIGRSTDSLMMMVTPRIIIQEEEEEKLGVQPL